MTTSTESTIIMGYQSLRQSASPLAVALGARGSIAVIRVAGLAAMVLFASTIAARADATTPQEQTYLTYQIGIQALPDCRETELSMEQQTKLGARINTLTSDAIGAGRRLFLVGDARRLVRDEGCMSAVVQSGLASYDADLASALK